MNKILKSSLFSKLIFNDNNVHIAPDGTEHYQTVVDKCHIDDINAFMIELSKQCEKDNKGDSWPMLELSPSGSWMRVLGEDRLDGAIYLEKVYGSDSRRHLLLTINTILFD